MKSVEMCNLAETECNRQHAQRVQHSYLPASTVSTEHVARMGNTMHLHVSYQQYCSGGADIRYSVLCEAAASTHRCSSLQFVKNRLAGDNMKQVHVMHYL